MNKKRIQQELQKLATNPPENCSAGLISESNIMHWTATIIGPVDTPYEGGAFNLDVRFTQEYPFKAPIIKFKTRVYHPNVDSAGNICLDILKETWSPALDMEKVLLSICSLLEDPNADDPLDPDSASMYREDINQFNQVAREYTLKYACSDEY